VPERISILGSTGSIGKSTLDVVREHPEEFEVVALAAGVNVTQMIEQVHEFHPRLVAMATEEAAAKVKREIPAEIPVLYGQEGLLQVALHEASTYVVAAVVGSQGLPATLAAIEAGKTIGLANKETLVTAGHIVMKAAQKAGVTLYPIDSEHSAIDQCLKGENRAEVRRLILTASGGAFRDLSRAELTQVNQEQALNHPNWSMGPKITIDTATMMNKGLEVIEAHWLFGFPYEQIDVVIHPQSVIHSMVEFVDGAVMAQLGTPDMRVPIQYALTSPQRRPRRDEPLDFTKLAHLEFRPLDWERYPCVKMAYEAGKTGGTMPTVLNAANEAAVQLFLQEKIPFLEIEERVERALASHQSVSEPDLETIMSVDAWAREFVNSM
jgi:1-deoxy-D-xylulose-5-phosphate reductoisomerase